MLELNYLQELVRSGLSILPIRTDGTKRPAISEWGTLQTEHPTDDELELWARMHSGIGIVCGQISGGVEIVDVDCKNDKSGTLWQDLQERLALAKVHNVCIQRTKNSGYHIIYRTTAGQGNKKIAINAQKLCIIETRGEGGYFAAHPTPGYEVIAGDLRAVPVMPDDERERLMVVCRSFNEVFQEARVPKDQILNKNESKPGDEYNAKITQAEFLALIVAHGWKVAFEKSGVVYLTRPGKDEGVSASLFYGGRMLFHVFTSNAPHFDCDRSYDPFGVYARLEHNGDFRSAANALKGEGYAKDVEGQTAEAVVFDDPVMEFLNDFYRFRYNVVLGRYYWADNENPNDWKLFKDRDLNSLWLRTKQNRIKTSKDFVKTVIESDFTDDFNPFLWWYHNLPKHDNVDYIAQLARTITTDTAQNQQKFHMWLTKWLVAHVAQMETTKANHTALVLKGGQGVGKTTWLNKLCPEELAEYRYVGPIKRDDKDMQIVLAERFLVNLDELETMQRIEIGSLKSYMTTDEITVRRPYDRFADVLRRWASFVGSVNKSRFLTDDTGNRRFLVVEALEIDHNHGIEMKRVWAQAKDLFLSGYRYWFDADEIADVSDSNNKYRKVGLAEELVGHYIMQPDDGTEPLFQTATDIVAWLSVNFEGKVSTTNLFIQEIGAAMVNAGFVQTKKKGKYGYELKYKEVVKDIFTPSSFGDW